MLMPTLNQHLGNPLKITSGQDLVHNLFVEVIKVSVEDEPDFFEVCHTTGSDSTAGLQKYKMEVVQYTIDQQPTVELDVANQARDFTSVEHSGKEGTNSRNQCSVKTLESECGIHPKTIDGIYNTTSTETTSKTPEYSSHQVDCVNNYMHVIHHKQNGIVGSPHAPEPQ
ncbi:hypothetical protein ACH5RR_018648 [Cinchona calisaya]|uniref:Uncharacterized protein n=1 Tax=Cinchona calisaya TaxID=153742 RepID=A0ABD2ZM17_9GENT